MQTDKSVERPLHSLRVIEFEGIGPGPLAGRMLSDMGAHVIVVARPAPSAVDRTLIGENTENPLRQGKEIIVLDLKTANGVIAALDLVADADALIEGNRPGVMERLGLGPTECAVRNARLVYGRMTGWGQSGPLAQAAGHDLNYIDDCRQPIENAARSELRIARSPPHIVVIGPSHRYFPLTREQVSVIARSSPR